MSAVDAVTDKVAEIREAGRELPNPVVELVAALAAQIDGVPAPVLTPQAEPPAPDA